MSVPKYPLSEVKRIKQNRFDQAQKILEEKKEELKTEEKKLKEVEQARDKVLEHKIEKLNQIRDELDAGTTSDKIQQMKTYLKIVETNLEEEETKVKEQQKQVEYAEKQVEQAVDEVFRRQKDLEKMQIHEKEWTAEARDEQQKKIESERDELGSMTYEQKRKKKLS